jgi:hypothetical protein
VKDDGSWGVHAPQYSKQLMEEGVVFTKEALAILEQSKKTAAK